jgi:hypothetical protein
VAPDARGCVRCWSNGEEVCILREVGDGGEVSYKAYGVEGRELGEMIEGMLGEREKEMWKGGRWALPECEEGYRGSVNPGRWMWRREGEGKMKGVEWHG